VKQNTEIISNNHREINDNVVMMDETELNSDPSMREPPASFHYKLCGHKMTTTFNLLTLKSKCTIACTL